MKTAVDKISKGNGRIVNTRFYTMVAHYLFEADFCNAASGWDLSPFREKGIVEMAIPFLGRTYKMRVGASGSTPNNNASAPSKS